MASHAGEFTRSFRENRAAGDWIAALEACISRDKSVGDGFGFGDSAKQKLNVRIVASPRGFDKFKADIGFDRVFEQAFESSADRRVGDSSGNLAQGCPSGLAIGEEAVVGFTFQEGDGTLRARLPQELRGSDSDQSVVVECKSFEEFGGAGF